MMDTKEVLEHFRLLKEGLIEPIKPEPKPQVIDAPPLPDDSVKMRRELKYLLDRYGENSYQYTRYCIEQRQRTEWWDNFRKEVK